MNSQPSGFYRSVSTPYNINTYINTQFQRTVGLLLWSSRNWGSYSIKGQISSIRRDVAVKTLDEMKEDVIYSTSLHLDFKS